MNNFESDQLHLHEEVQYVKGVGPYVAGLLKKKNIRSVLDLIYEFPFRYLDRRNLFNSKNLTPGKEKSFVGKVIKVSSRKMGFTKRKIFEVQLADLNGVVYLTFFQFNERYFNQVFSIGKSFLVTGECRLYMGKKQFTHPEIDEWDSENEEENFSFIPIYSLTEGLHQKTMRRIIKNTLDKYLHEIEESPLSVRASNDTKLSLQESILKIHYPTEEASIEDLTNQVSKWHQRVAYDEMFYLQLGLGIKKMGIEKDKAYQITSSSSLYEKALSLLPFKLTMAQSRVISEILTDQKRDFPMNRLLQGDVGCGKTLVAFLSSLTMIESNYQVAMMVPTEILAKQHGQSLKEIANNLGVKIEVLTGSMKKKEREPILEDLKHGEIDFLIGTHALIQDEVIFKKLGMIIIDEQHRFGVEQRAKLKSKGISQDKPPLNPHVLVMTATPIPRTLSMCLYSDLDISVIDELPSGRKEIKTKVFFEKQRQKAYDFILKELEKGRQVYFVYPLIEESEKIDLKAATVMVKELEKVFSKYKVSLMHGKMTPGEKDQVMSDFQENRIQVLVSTTVIEVGVNVPNSTVMVVEHAERFGLSQLHQLRGRVGRGAAQSYCLLMAGYARSEESRFRLKVMEETNDGFKISEEDLKIRGPGDFLGVRQSGLPDFRLAHLVRDGLLLSHAQSRVEEILSDDPALDKLEHQILKRILKTRWEGKLALADIS